ncbi:MAG: RHS repeat-associated core domain-containing protein, partial [Thermoanaerobaculia bacterium]|nr:RHS repeat-associated core domain-containing protein [Thermoanaerobaculia bacterium]
NAAGRIVASPRYDPFGADRDTQSARQQIILGVNRGMAGSEQDQEIALVNLQGRLYDPRFARFLQPDPDPLFPRGFQASNRFSYALNNPLRYVDRNGMRATEQLPEGWHPPIVLRERVPEWGQSLGGLPLDVARRRSDLQELQRQSEAIGSDLSDALSESADLKQRLKANVEDLARFDVGRATEAEKLGELARKGLPGNLLPWVSDNDGFLKELNKSDELKEELEEAEERVRELQKRLDSVNRTLDSLRSDVERGGLKTP